ncbi:MAG: hypothetical protein QOF66_1316 [Mycobacterium sp.]|nr:hypothetical protein [Mycobacterium sp.]
MDITSHLVGAAARRLDLLRTLFRRVEEFRTALKNEEMDGAPAAHPAAFELIGATEQAEIALGRVVGVVEPLVRSRSAVVSTDALTTKLFQRSDVRLSTTPNAI